MAGTTWPTLTAGQKARASDVESKFDWLEGDIVPMSGGNMTTGVYDLGTSTAAWRYIHLSGGIMASGATALAVDVSARVKLRNGAAIDEFSTDGLLSDNSDTAVPTEKAVRTYADTKAGAIGMQKILLLTTPVASLTTTGYVTIYSVDTNGVWWGMCVASAFNGTMEVLIDGITMLVSSVTAANFLAVQDDIATTVDTVATLSTLQYTTASRLTELQLPFKDSLTVNMRKAAAGAGTTTTYLKIATR